MKKFELLIVWLILILISIFIVLKNESSSTDFSVDIVNDVIHDKYEKNSDEYYIYRIDKDEKKLKNDSGDLILYDNLALAYDHIWKLDKALEIYKIKEDLMEKREYDMQNWYRYYANLWTFLIHHGIKGWFKDKSDTKSQDLIVEGRNDIQKAIEINIDAHFWRENYQLVANDWIISAFKNPLVMTSQNMLWKATIDPLLLTSDNSWKSCWEKHHDIYPVTKKVGKTVDEQIYDSCPMALKWVIWMVRFWWGPSPYSFVTVGDILTAMWEYKLAFASYARAVNMKHPNSAEITKYSEKLAQKIYPTLSPQEAFEKLQNQYNSDYKVWSDWSNKYLEYQKNIIVEWKDPTLTESYDDFYKKYKHPVDVEYVR